MADHQAPSSAPLRLSAQERAEARWTPCDECEHPLSDHKLLANTLGLATCPCGCVLEIDPW